MTCPLEGPLSYKSVMPKDALVVLVMNARGGDVGVREREPKPPRDLWLDPPSE